MTYKNFITIRDVTSATKLWEGDPVVILGSSITMNSSNLLKMVPKTFQETNLTDDDKNHSEKYMANFNRRKTNVSYAGFNNNVISLSVIYDANQVGTTAVLNIDDVSNLYKIFTPSKLMEIVLKPRTLYLKDQLLVPLLSVNEVDDDNTPAIYPSYGIPVLLKSWSLKPIPNTTQIEMTLTFMEDRI